ncbi:sensor histidine kinase [Plantactinospora sp. S1510]|uniref:Sensor histidine kinase n=1 Tax=Plantactinospora alkalitolerans TaxID=2789879 RepID=A0ABS0H4Q7_9ACTN|nr:histidine kinase [Plantactinospora alkalitolerans]MBF9133446.1 sensor histidine kinase [Plantactinospora alkalitolerans]
MTDPRRGVRFGSRFGWLVAVVWLVYLGEPLGTIWKHPSGLARDLGLAAIVVFGAGYLGLFIRLRAAIWRRRPIPPGQAAAALGGLFAVGTLTIPSAGEDWLVTLVYVSASAVLILPTRPALGLVAVLAVIPVAVPQFVPTWEPESGVAFAVLLAALAVFAFSRLVERQNQLLDAQQEIHRLAVAEERARTARDLHDILGHSLTVIAVKAELAGRLLEVDPGRAGAEVADLERLAREALADVRSTVGAYREITLSTELASARTALRAAGVAAELPTSDVELPPARSELFGWAVREGVTNVVRHSGARRCVIRVRLDEVEVLDDGRGPLVDGADGPHPGHGLLGLRERAEQLGARVVVGRGPGGRGFRLQVSFAGRTP